MRSSTQWLEVVSIFRWVVCFNRRASGGQRYHPQGIRLCILPRPHQRDLDSISPVSWSIANIQGKIIRICSVLPDESCGSCATTKTGLHSPPEVLIRLKSSRRRIMATARFLFNLRRSCALDVYKRQVAGNATCTIILRNIILTSSKFLT